MVWLCSNLGNAPLGTPNRPAAPGQLAGTMTGNQVSAIAAQGIEAGAMKELVAALQRQQVYLNVHSDRFPGGEVRGQIHLIRDRR